MVFEKYPTLHQLILKHYLPQISTIMEEADVAGPLLRTAIWVLSNCAAMPAIASKIVVEENATSILATLYREINGVNSHSPGI